MGKVNSLSVECPYCLASKGSPCRAGENKLGNVGRYYVSQDREAQRSHTERTQKAKRLAAKKAEETKS